MKTPDILITPTFHVEHEWPVNFREDDLSDFEAERVYDTKGSHLKYLNGVWVSPDSVIYKNGVIFQDSLAAPFYRPYYRFRHLIKKAVFSKKVRLEKGVQYLLVSDLWSTGHFHWFCDLLPRIWSIRERIKEFVLLLPDDPYIRKIGLQSLEMLGLDFRDIVWMQSGNFYHIPDLLFLQKICPSGHMHPEVMRSLSQALLKGSEPGTNRLYISRNKAAYRKILNEHEVVALLQDHGFHVYVGEDHSLRDQITVFSSADVLLGVHGAGLTNCIFMHPGSSVVELRKKENGPSNVGYWHLADSLEHKFYYYNGTPDSPLPLVGRGCNLSVDPVVLQRTVLDKLK